MIKTTHYRLTLDTLAAWSPWWLLLLVPAAVAVMFWLYWRQVGDVRRGMRHLLPGLRTITVTALVILMFRPKAEIHRTTEYGGRMVVLVDNSLSLSVTDVADEPPAWRAYARRTGISQDDNRYYRATLQVDELRAILRELRNLQEGDFMAGNRYWRFLAARRAEVVKLAAEIGAVADDAGRERLAQATALFDETAVDAASLRELTRQAIVRLGEVRVEMENRERGEDETATSPPPAVPGWNRLELSARILDEEFQQRCRDLHPRQSFEVRTLHALPDHDRQIGWDGDSVRAGGSDVVAVLDQLITEEHEMPLSGVIVVSDGRWSGRREALTTMTERYRARHLPIHTLGVGGREEPADNAVIQVQAPEFAVVGRQVSCRVLLKTAFPPPSGKLQLIVSHEDRQLAVVDVASDGRLEYEQIIEFTLDRPGVQEVKVALTPLAGELTTANNALTIPVEVLERRLRVLYLEERPHWQARFVANVLMRLPHVELNRIVAQTAPGARLARGVGLGTWPNSHEILDLYDLVVVGDVPPDILTAEEWQQLLAWSGQAGRTLALLFGERHLPTAYPGHPLADILPVVQLQPVATRSLADWMLTPAGTDQRLTRSWSRMIRTGEQTAPAAQLAADSACLAYEQRESRPLLAWRPHLDGKVVVWTHPMTWLRLNESYLDLHMGLWVNLVVWSRRVDLARGGPICDSLSLGEDTPVSVLWPAGAATLTLAPYGEEDGEPRKIAGETLFADVMRYPLGALAAGRWQIATDNAGETMVLHVFERQPEFGLLSRDDKLLSDVAMATGGLALDIGNAPAIMAVIEGKEATVADRFIFHLWRHWLTIVLLAFVVIAEWIMRKWAGKI